jgi:hypothetical protein
LQKKSIKNRSVHFSGRNNANLVVENSQNKPAGQPNFREPDGQRACQPNKTLAGTKLTLFINV